MTSSLIPTVDEKTPSDQNSSFQYIFFTHGKYFLISRLVFYFIFPTITDTEYLGGMVITKWGKARFHPRTHARGPQR